MQVAQTTLLPDLTAFIIAHRLSTIRHADRIMVLDQARIVASGRHAELLARSGPYLDLSMTQQSQTA